MFAMLHRKYWIITSYICNGKRHKWKGRGEKKQNGEMTKPVKIGLPCLRITKLGCCYYLPSFKMPELGEACSVQSTFLFT